MTTKIQQPAFPAEPSARQNLKLAPGLVALLLVFGGETIFFGTLLSSFLFVRVEMAASQPAHTLARLWLPVTNTFILLLSTFLISRAVPASRAGNGGRLRQILWIALLLGLLFVTGQFTEFRNSGMTPNDPALGGMYFALIGFHALHVLAGMVLTALTLASSYLGGLSPKRHEMVQATYWFWLYVSAVWLVLFAALYVV